MKSARNRFPVTLYLDKKLSALVRSIAEKQHSTSLSLLTEKLWKREVDAHRRRTAAKRNYRESVLGKGR